MELKTGIKNIIFDFGAVIIDINPSLTITAFRDLGIENVEEHYSLLGKNYLFDELERGLITAAEFRNRIRNSASIPLSDEQINKAWNATLLDVPKSKIDFLEKLKNQYRLFLLSNTNEIHEHAFNEMIMKKFGEDVLRKNFERVYLSHHLKMQKPDPEIFLHVLTENKLIANETLFVDDSPQHIEAAKKLGFQTFYFEKGKNLSDIF